MLTLFPDITPQKCVFAQRSNTQTNVSPLNRRAQTTELPGARWYASMTFSRSKTTQARQLIAFLISLRGQAGRFYLHDYTHPTPAGIATGTPIVAGASQVGGSLATSGWTASQTGILKAGDWIGVNGELKMIIADANSDAAGLATLSIEPPLRNSPANGAAITTNKPTATFMLTEDTVQWLKNPGDETDITITAIEALS